MKVVCGPEQLAPPASQAAAPPSCSTLTGTELPQAKEKKSLVFMNAGSLRSGLTLCDPVDCGLPGFSVREGDSPSKNTGAYWPILVAILC